MTLDSELYNRMAAIVNREDGNEEAFIAAGEMLRKIIDNMTDEQRVLLEASKFFSLQAVTNDEPRLMYASVACIALSGLMTPVFDQFDSVGDIMDYAERMWTDTRALADQAISEMLFGGEGSPEAG